MLIVTPGSSASSRPAFCLSGDRLSWPLDLEFGGLPRPRCGWMHSFQAPRTPAGLGGFLTNDGVSGAHHETPRWTFFTAAAAYDRRQKERDQ
jgi:hypothetical protein